MAIDFENETDPADDAATGPVIDRPLHDDDEDMDDDGFEPEGDDS